MPYVRNIMRKSKPRIYRQALLWVWGERTLVSVHVVRPSSHRTRNTSQQACANKGTPCCQWQCSHILQATSWGLHANLPDNVLMRPVWTRPKNLQSSPLVGFTVCAILCPSCNSPGCTRSTWCCWGFCRDQHQWVHLVENFWRYLGGHFVWVRNALPALYPH